MMNTSRYILLVALSSFLVSLPLAAQINDTYVIPVSANVAGNFGTRWLTQFSVFNPQLDHPSRQRYIPPHGRRHRDRADVHVPANGTVLSDNILDDLFGLKTGSGGLLVATFPEDNPKFRMMCYPDRS